MKKITAILLALVLTFCALSFGSHAAEISPKIDAELAEKILSGEEGGEAVELYFHYDEYPLEGVSQEQADQNFTEATLKIIRKLAEMMYVEVFNFSPVCINIGLPYSSMETVAALDEVDAIRTQPKYSDRAPAEKLTAEEWDLLSEEKAKTEVTLSVGFAYSNNVFIGFDDETFEGTAREYADAVRARKEAYFTGKNTEYIQPVLEAANIKEYTLMNVLSKASITTTVSQVEKIAACKEVSGMSLYSIDGEKVHTEEISVYANEPQDFSQIPPMQNCKEKFDAWISETEGVQEYEPLIHADNMLGIYYNFDILYYKMDDYYGYRVKHHNSEYGYAIISDCFTNNTNNWMLVQAYVNLPSEGKDYRYLKIGDRVLRSFKAGAQKYAFGLFIYDETEDTFTPIEEADLHKYDDPQYYMSIEKEIIHFALGNRVGDADMDGKVTVIDATTIQKVKASLKKESRVNMGAADYDGDGVVSVIDATRIQKMLANLE